MFVKLVRLPNFALFFLFLCAFAGTLQGCGKSYGGGPGSGPQPLEITAPSALPSAEFGMAYSATLSATGRTAPYTWTLSSGTLPTSLFPNASTGVISGTP